ncbi:hypothetical protein [Endozoicomonas sp. ONNA2]|uniref:hypothetical protein n=1 Tax=Endozoicomonas sp. ONNA2 TaxID=2828741 RepID=UPI0021478EC2|nr:hypothetical protein [Endozoicomonas sp. ONNA2]
MDQIKLNTQHALLYSWHRRAKSLLPIRAMRSLANGGEAYFGRFSISALASKTQRLMKEHPNARYTQKLRNPLSAYNISIPAACKDSTPYISEKVEKLHAQGRKLQVKLAFNEDGRVAPIPMYNSDNSPPIKLNGTAHFSDTDPWRPGEEIVCRHFAWAYATRVFGRGKDTFKIIDTPEKIQKLFAERTFQPKVKGQFFVSDLSEEQKSFHNIPYCADGYYFLEGSFSEALASLAEKYWNMAGGDQKNFIFRTDVGLTEHGMALRLKKQDGCMKVIFYDPNATLRHKTFLLSEPGLAAHITNEELGIKYFRGALLNIDDRKQSVDECDVRLFGSSHSVQFEFHTKPCMHNHHPLLKKPENR